MEDAARTPDLAEASVGYDRFSAMEPRDLVDTEKEAVVRLALAVLDEKLSYGELFTDGGVAKNYFRLKLVDRKAEVFAAAFLTTRHALIEYEELFFGSIDGASVHPRVVAQRALELNASAVIVAHNHPSGDPGPSRSDESLTRRLKESLSLLEVRVLDHIIVGKGDPVSLAEEGMV